AKERALSAGEIAPVLEALAASLSHFDDDVREDAVELLGIIGRSVPDVEAVGPGGASIASLLVRALADPDAGVREEAAEALGLLGKGAREAVTALERAALDPKKGVRKAAREALWRIERDTAASPAVEIPRR
ncbi:MAG TPA: HEAT repeat domain-containing protein, partial [Planctomycetota bacterium]|nr:HEAT repeat domain-containing protein [Planctomycetota bacterium]